MSSPPDDDILDDALRDAFTPLRRLEPSAAARAANRRSVTDELARLSAPRAGGRLRRAPKLLATVACALLVGFAAGWAAHARSSTVATSVADADPPPAVTHDAPRTEPQSPPQPTHYASEIYLCGVGRLSSSSGYTFQEFDR